MTYTYVKKSVYCILIILKIVTIVFSTQYLINNSDNYSDNYSFAVIIMLTSIIFYLLYDCKIVFYDYKNPQIRFCCDLCVFVFAIPLIAVCYVIDGNIDNIVSILLVTSYFVSLFSVCMFGMIEYVLDSRVDDSSNSLINEQYLEP